MLELLIAEGSHTWQELEARFDEHARARSERVTLSWRQLQRIAAGEIARPRPAVARVLVDMFGVGIHELLSPPKDTTDCADVTSPDEIRRREFLAGVAVASVGAVASESLGRLIDGLEGPPPRRIGTADVVAVEAAADAYMQFDLARSADLALTFGRSTLSWATRLLALEMPDATRERLASAIALLADRMGWTMFDAGSCADAGRLLTFALDHAARGADHDLRAHVMLDLSTLMTDTGSPQGGVGILRAALGDERVSAGERANIHAVCARHCAAAGQHDAGLRHVLLAERALDDDHVDRTPDWARHITYGPGHHDSALGLALFALGERAAARRRLESAVHGLDRGRTRTGLRCRIRLAVLDLQEGDREAGETEGCRIVQDAAGVTSARVRNDLQMLHDTGARHGADRLVADLRPLLTVI